MSPSRPRRPAVARAEHQGSSPSNGREVTCQYKSFYWTDLVDELDGSLDAKCEDTDSSHPRTGEVHIVQDVLHHVQPLAEVDVMEEVLIVPHSVVPDWSLEQDLVSELPGGGERQDVDSSLVTPLLLSDDQRIDALNAHVEAAREERADRGESLIYL